MPEKWVYEIYMELERWKRLKTRNLDNLFGKTFLWKR